MIRFFAKGRCAHCVTDDKLTKGSVGIEVRFYLEDWDAAPNRVAVFKAGSVKVDVALLSDSCTVPPEVLANPGDMLVIGVYGTDSGGDIVIPTVYADAGRVRLGAAPSGIEPTPTTQPLIDQLVAAAEEAERIAQSVRDDADNGVFDGEDGADGNSVWWTTSGISTIPGSRYVVLLPNLNGPAGTSPVVSDLVVGPSPNTSGSATYLYYIFGVDTTNQLVILKSIGSIKGAQGDPGDNGVSPSVSVSEITGGHQVSITDAQGTETFDVMDGQDGSPGVGVPSGGTSGQVLKKNSSTDYDTEWADESGSVQSVNGKTGVVVLDSDDVGAIAAPDGGSVGQVLKKTASGAEWADESGGGGSVTVDSALSGSSENPVQNKVIKAALDNKGTYSKPSGGIPKTDLASDVQTSLGKADTAYQKPSGGIPATDLASGVIPTVPSASSAAPQALGTAAAGSSTDYARADHVHAKPSAADVGAVASNQGSGNAGKFLVVGSDGNVTTMTLAAWQGGSF